MSPTLAQKTSVKEPKTDEDAQAHKAEDATETIEIGQTGQTVKITQATVPTGIFPMPSFIRRWAGLS